MTEDRRTKIIEKIRKLFAMTSSSNQHEAELAAERASELMKEYQISAAEIDFKDIKSGARSVNAEMFQVPDLSMRLIWVETLGQASAFLFDGNVIANRNLWGTSFHFVGFQDEIPLMKELFLYLYRSWFSIVSADLIRAKSDSEKIFWSKIYPGHDHEV